MLEYLNINNCSYGEIVNKINECVRSLNIVEAGKQSGKTPAQHQLAICAACGNLIKPGKPAATGFHCVLCGAALPHNIDMKNGVWEGGAGNTEEFL